MNPILISALISAIWLPVLGFCFFLFRFMISSLVQRLEKLEDKVDRIEIAFSGKLDKILDKLNDD